MKPREFSFSQYTGSPNLRDHLEAILRHAEAASRISENQFPIAGKIKLQHEVQLPPHIPHIKVDSENIYTKSQSRFVIDSEENTVINDSLHKIGPQRWNYEILNYPVNYTVNNRSLQVTEDHLGLNGHLSEIKRHTRSAIEMLEGSDPPPIGCWVLGLIIIFLLAFCGQQTSDQDPQRQPQQNQGYFQNTPTVVATLASNNGL
ncbi:hypothetical protein [Calothrix sp. NIES-3974]|uniref:hypothetical protein n=1 Tax=Calothrix sp. NIES-3974 TaxID=2005462 RepID=UPI000B615B43|nr:hypothetical protein [Calothrix sp. NIES-3974]BAZ03469.1 hypothetical protein NIES3974_00950 [Calothrix sp. NIES-3974]